LWRSEEQGHHLLYDCKYCHKKGWYKNRVCFLKNNEILLKCPIFEIDASAQKESVKIVSSEIKKMNKEDVVKKLIECHEMLPNKLVHDVITFPCMRMGLNNEIICPPGLFDYDSDFYVSLETAAGKYHTLPYPGSYLDQPQDIIEAFDTIRSAEARYNNYQMNLIKMKDKETSKK
jgi:hypothetical protein